MTRTQAIAHLHTLLPLEQEKELERLQREEPEVYEEVISNLS